MSRRLDKPTIMVPCFNASATIEQALESALSQSFSRLEVVVVDDGSTDDSLVKIRRVASVDDRLTVLNKENGGTWSALNMAAEYASGGWLVPLGADDLLEPDAVAKQLAFIEQHPGFDIYSWAARYLLPDGEVDLDPFALDLGPAEVIDLGRLAASERLPQIGSLWIDAQTFRASGGYRNVHAEDYDLGARLLAAGACWVVNPEPLYGYRVTAGSKTTDFLSQYESVADSLRFIISTGRLDVQRQRDAQKALRRLETEVNRVKFGQGLIGGQKHGLRRLYMAGLRFESFADRWLWGLPIALVNPNLLTGRVGSVGRRRLGEEE